MLPTIQELVFKHLLKAREAREKAPSLLEGQLHTNASSAGQCARAIGFRVAALDGETPDGESLVNFEVGDAIHDLVQKAMLAQIPNAESEKSGVVKDFITFRADLVYPAEDGKTVVTEIKSVSDFGFEKATGLALKSNGRWKKKNPDPPEGAKPEHLLQVGITATGLEGEYMAVVYARKTAAKDEPVFHEWRYRVADFREVIDMEIERHRQIVESVKQGFLPNREYQGQVISNPSTVKYPCGYCAYYAPCLRSGAGPISINTLRQSNTVAPDTKETQCEDLKNETQTVTPSS